MKYIIVGENDAYTVVVKNGFPTITFPVGIRLYDDPPAPDPGSAVLSVDVPAYLIGTVEGIQVLYATASNGVQFADQITLAIGTVEAP